MCGRRGVAGREGCQSLDAVLRLRRARALLVGRGRSVLREVDVMLLGGLELRDGRQRGLALVGGRGRRLLLVLLLLRVGAGLGGIQQGGEEGHGGHVCNPGYLRIWAMLLKERRAESWGILMSLINQLNAAGAWKCWQCFHFGDAPQTSRYSLTPAGKGSRLTPHTSHLTAEVPSLPSSSLAHTTCSYPALARASQHDIHLSPPKKHRYHLPADTPPCIPHHRRLCLSCHTRQDCGVHLSHVLCLY